ncbi:peptidoglycan-binding domain 1 protein [Calothrix sp. NIES-4101]|nr:peptidoglycan-binding domain 1 protein [Calothrix sp. NIES-4101]
MTTNRIVFVQNSVIKQQPIESSQLPSNQRQDIPAGTTLVLQSYNIPPGSNNHYKISLDDIQFKGFSNWFAFANHVQIIQEPIVPETSVEAVIAKQTDKTTAHINVNRNTLGTQQGFLKLVFNVDTFIKRAPVDSQTLNEQSKQLIPAGTELILATNLPDNNNIVKFPIQSNHVKFNLFNVEIKGFSQDWYAFIKHVGIQRVG